MTLGWHYKDVLQAILNTEIKPLHIDSIMRAIIRYDFSRTKIQQALDPFGAADITHYKEDVLDLLLSYVNIILNDHAISEREFQDFGLLKILFKIKEGDFFEKRFHQVTDVINQQMAHITQDGVITLDETFTTANLQGLFDLTSEQFFSLWQNATPSVRRSK